MGLSFFVPRDHLYENKVKIIHEFAFLRFTFAVEGCKIILLRFYREGVRL